MVIGRMISRLFCWAIMKKMSKKWDLETSNEETEPKTEIYAKNWARQALLKYFDFGQCQQSTTQSKLTTRSTARSRSMAWSTTRDADVCWREMLTWHKTILSRRMEARDDAIPGVWGAWEWLTELGGTWNVCSWGRNLSWRVWAHVRWFLAVLGWVCLGSSDLLIYGLTFVV